MKLAYGQKNATKGPAKGKDNKKTVFKRLTNRIKGRLTAGALSLMLVGGGAALQYGCERIEKDKTTQENPPNPSEDTTNPPEDITEPEDGRRELENLPGGFIRYKEDIYGSGGLSEYLVYGREDSIVKLVCEEPCPVSSSLMLKKYIGIDKAVDELKEVTGTEFSENMISIWIHITTDSKCGDWWIESGISGFTYVISRTHICTWEYEKTNMLVPLDEDNADRLAQQGLVAHELVHAMQWFNNSGDGWTTFGKEAFARIISHYICGYYVGSWTVGEREREVTDDSNFIFGLSVCDDRMKFSDTALLNYLCELYGFDADQYNLIFTGILAKAEEGIRVDALIFKEIVDDIVGQDTSEAFEMAGIEI